MAKRKNAQSVEGQLTLDSYLEMLQTAANNPVNEGETNSMTLASYISTTVTPAVDETGEYWMFDTEPEELVKSNIIERTGKPVVFRPVSGVKIPVGLDERVSANILALRELETLNASGAYATTDQQNILYAYTGWEGITKEELGDTEWGAVTEALTDAFPAERVEEIVDLPKYPHHISARVTDTMNKILSNIGFKAGNLLLSGIGAGDLLCGLPRSVISKSIVNIDATDGVNGEISSFLFPKTEVMDMTKPLPESYYDAAIGIVPILPERDGQLTIKHNTITLPTFACQFGRTLRAVRTGGVLLLLIDRENTDSVKEILTPFSLSTTPLNFIGGLRMDSGAMGNEKIYDLLVFQKVSDKKCAETKDLYERAGYDVHVLGQTGTVSIRYSSYFRYCPEMVMGNTMFYDINAHKLVISELSDADYGTALNHAIKEWDCKNHYNPVEVDDETEDSTSLPADPNVRNFSMVLINGEVYQRVDSRMIRQKLKGARLERVKGMIYIRDQARKLYDLQLKMCGDEELEDAQKKLGELYDKFFAQYGPLTDRTNSRLMREDAECALLASLETVDEEDEIHKSDIFTMRTIMMRKAITHCDTINEAFTVCMDQKAYVDVAKMAMLCGKSEAEVIDSCIGRLFFMNPYPTSERDAWIAKDAYLCGNVREKLCQAKNAAESDSDFEANIAALESVQPPLIPAKDISLKLGAPYIPTRIIQKFIFEVIGKKTCGMIPSNFKIERDSKGKWRITSDAYIMYNDPRFYSEYGMPEHSALSIITRLMNSTELTAYKSETDPVTGKNIRVKDPEQTVVLNDKADTIQNAFQFFVMDGGACETEIVEVYNAAMNTNVVPKYDGSHLTFTGMTSTVDMKQHQKNAVYRIIRENGALLSHVVGAGKTFTMIAAGMELKRLGRVTKPLYVVPNNLLFQWGSETMRLYPTAKILLAEPDDMRCNRRKRFLSRMATGDYDIIIMGSSSFVALPPPFETVETAIDELIESTAEAKNYSENRSQLATQKMLDDRMTFFKRCQVAPYDLKDIGVDFMFLDESHEYKNLNAATSHSNLRGLSCANSVAKCTDMYYKTKYFSSLYNQKGGFVFATGTAITNSIVEMYSLQRYFQEDDLIARGITSLDEWLAVFGTITTDWELPPEGLAENGKGFRQVSRVSSFANVPELMGMVLQFMDCVTRDEINMDTPTPVRKTIASPPNASQQWFMQQLVERANAIRSHGVDPKADNMLLVTVDGRKAALDMRAIDESYRAQKNSKVDLCAKQITELYRQFNPVKGTQVVFCDMAVPSGKGFNIYEALKSRLSALGVPENDIAFAHDFKTSAQKTAMQIKMQTGKIRVLIGSTPTIGQGVNIQKRLVALHNLDVPWVPKDIEQREGRILRPNNMNTQAYLFSYVTEGSFDAYMYQLIETKARLISQVLRGDLNQRVIEDIDTKVLSYAEIKAIATGDTRFLERAKTEGALQKLMTLRRDYESRTATLKVNVNSTIPHTIDDLEKLIPRIKEDMKLIDANPADAITVGGSVYCLNDDEERAAAAGALTRAKDSHKIGDCIGMYRGMSVVLSERANSWLSYRFECERFVVLQGRAAHSIDESYITSGLGILRACKKIVEEIPNSLTQKEERLTANYRALESAKSLLKEGFEYDDEIKQLTEKLAELTSEIAKVS